MLMKTYVDQIAREKLKIEEQEEEKRQMADQNGLLLDQNNDNKENFKKSYTRKSTINSSTMVTIRNNEGKVCKTKEVSKKSKGLGKGRKSSKKQEGVAGLPKKADTNNL